jgi:hypothetical protein
MYVTKQYLLQRTGFVELVNQDICRQAHRAPGNLHGNLIRRFGNSEYCRNANQAVVCRPTCVAAPSSVVASNETTPLTMKNAYLIGSASS